MAEHPIDIEDIEDAVENESENSKDILKVRNSKNKRKSLKNRSNNETSVKMMDVDGKKKLLGVLFAPYTENSELSKRWRAKIEIFEKVGDMRLKIVERTGDKLTDLLHKSNVCEDSFCERKDCLICTSTSENQKKGMCKKRNVVYETYCISCMKREKHEKELKETNREVYNCTSSFARMFEINGRCIFDESCLDGRLKRKRDFVYMRNETNKETYNVKYIGETGRSGYERALEHVRDFLD